MSANTEHDYRSSAQRVLLSALCVAAGITLVLTVSRFISSPLRFDEADFAAQVSGIQQHGVPKLLYSEDARLFTTSYYGYDAHYGMWHPPLYMYSLAASAIVFGNHNAALRGAGLVWFALSLWLVWRISQLLIDGSHSVMVRAVPLALVALSPLLAEGSLYLDIDNTSLTCGLLLFAYVFLKDPEGCSLRQMLLLTLAFTFALSSKLTTPFIMLFCVGLYHVLNGNFRKAVIQGVFIGITGVALFSIGYVLYCWLLKYPPAFMFDVTYFGKRDMYAAPQKLMAVMRSLRWNFVWISPPIALMLLGLFAHRGLNWIRHRRLERVDFLAIFSAVGLATYTVWGGMFGKYTFPPVLAGVTAIGILVSRSLISLRIARPAVLVSFLAAVAAIHLFAVPGLQVRRAGFDVGTVGLRQSLMDPRNLALAVTVTVLVCSALVANRFLVASTKWSAVAIMTLMFLIVANPINSMKIAFSSDDRSPYHSSEERGFAETVDFLNESLGKDDVIVAPKDIGSGFHGKHYSTESELARGDLAGFRRLAISQQVSCIVDSEAFPIIPDRDFLQNNSSVRLIKQVGSFQIYQNLSRVIDARAESTPPTN